MMDNFKEKIIGLEQKYDDLTYFCRRGNNPVILTAVHTMMQKKENGEYKYAEPYTKAIAMYVAEQTDCFYLIKNKDTGIDSNSSVDDTFKSMLLDNIRDNDIKLVIDLHGAKREREFDVELGNLNNLSSDYSTLKELIEAFNENCIFKVDVNEPFKGGFVTRKVYFQTNCDVIQIEINWNYRDIERPENIKQVCDSLISFINQYIGIIKEND